MDLLKLVLITLKKNITLAITFAVLAVVGGIIHYSVQTISYVSNFKTNNGLVDYSLFKSLTDFKQITEDVYDLPAAEINEITTLLEDYRVSFIEETSMTISFTVVSKSEEADHKLLQDAVLNLINHNRFIVNSYANDLIILEKKRAFLEDKMNQLDSLVMNPTEYTNVNEVLRDSYDLYIEQLDLDEKLRSTGEFYLIKPVTEVKKKKRPIAIFLALYLVLAAFLFLLLSKKEPAVSE